MNITQTTLKLHESLEPLRKSIATIEGMHKCYQESALLPIQRINKAFENLFQPMTQFVQNAPKLFSPNLDDLAWSKDMEREYIADVVVSRLIELQEVLTQSAVVPLPQGAWWEQIRIDLQEGGDHINVHYGDAAIDSYHYSDLGFAKKNSRQMLPSAEWKLFVVLARCYELKHKEAPPTKNALVHQWKIAPTANALEKQMSRLSQKLSEVFGIPARPFLPYDPKEGYRTKFMLRPEPILRGDGKLHRSGMPFKDEIYRDSE